jgi:hypothetical protein
MGSSTDTWGLPCGEIDRVLSFSGKGFTVARPKRGMQIIPMWKHTESDPPGVLSRYFRVLTLEFL